MNIQYTKLFESKVNSQKVTYLLTESEIDTGEGVFTRYGAAIEMEDGERAVFLDIYGERGRTEVFIHRLWQGLVTPVTLFDIVSDRLYDDEFTEV